MFLKEHKGREQAAYEALARKVRLVAVLSAGLLL